MPSLEALARAREVLKIVNQASRKEWPAVEEWRRILPPWFLMRCAREETEAERAARIARWRSLSWVEKQREEREAVWSLSDWIYWLRPDERTWYWWDAAAVSDREAVVAVEADAWPFPWGALSWLFRAAAAVSVTPEEGAAADGS